MRFLKLYFFLLLFLSTNACFYRVDKTGYMFENVDFDNIKTNVTSKNTILKIFGSPTIISSNEYDDFWIYCSQDVKHILFFMPKVTKREVILLKFNQDNTVNFKKKLSLDDQNKKYAINYNKTFVESHETNFFKEIFGNLGTIKP